MMVDKQVIVQYIQHRDDEFYDEVRIFIRPRFKTSDLSGDEWRKAAIMQLYRKGELLYEHSVGTFDYAIATLTHQATYAREQVIRDYNRSKCFQPGCSEEATVHFRLKHRYYQGHIIDDEGFEYRRKFCDKHAHRGDSDFEDCDANYELVSGDAPDKRNIPNEDISAAQQMMVDMRDVDVNDQEALGKALRGAIDEARKLADEDTP